MEIAGLQFLTPQGRLHKMYAIKANSLTITQNWGAILFAFRNWSDPDNDEIITNAFTFEPGDTVTIKNVDNYIIVSTSRSARKRALGKLRGLWRIIKLRGKVHI